MTETGPDLTTETSTVVIVRTTTVRMLAYSGIGIMVAALTALGTDGINMNLALGFGGVAIVMGLASAIHQKLATVLIAGAVLLTVLNLAVWGLNIAVPYLLFYPISAIGAAVLSWIAILPVRRFMQRAADAAAKQSDQTVEGDA